MAPTTEPPPPSEPPTLRFCALASGSRGNALFVSAPGTSLLIDAGLPGREIQRRLSTLSVSPDGLSAILVSHEHVDHLAGVGVLARRWGLPVYISRRTFTAAESRLGRVDEVNHFDAGAAFRIGCMEIHPFSVCHDAADPVGFTVGAGGRRIGIATDLGVATRLVETHLKSCALVVLEANHDEAMLDAGPYPWSLKQRIRSRSGHLSNAAAARLLKGIRHDGLRHVVLGHLSEANNTPERALSAVGCALDGTATRLEAARQDRCGLPIDL